MPLKKQITSNTQQISPTRLNWDDIPYFLAVARTGSASSAASNLAVTHATVCRRIDKIEKALSLQLFERSQSGYQITTDGHIIFQHAEQMEQHALNIQRRLTGSNQKITGNLSISSIDSIIFDLSTFYSEFMAHHPGISLEVDASDQSVNLERLEADIAIRLTDQPPESLVGQFICHISFSAYASPNYLYKKSLNYISNPHQWIEVGNQKQYLKNRNLDFKTSTIFKTNSPGLALKAARQGAGLILLPNHIGNSDKQLVKLDIPEANIVTELWLLFHQDLRSCQKIRLFVDDFKRKYSNNHCKLPPNFLK